MMYQLMCPEHGPVQPGGSADDDDQHRCTRCHRMLHFRAVHTGHGRGPTLNQRLAAAESECVRLRRKLAGTPGAGGAWLSDDQQRAHGLRASAYALELAAADLDHLPSAGHLRKLAGDMRREAASVEAETADR